MTEKNYRIGMRWNVSDKMEVLLIGEWPEPIAYVTKHNVSWSGHCELPGIRTRVQYAPLSQQKSDIERGVRALLDMFGAVYLPLPTREATLCHKILDEVQIPRLGEDDLTLQLSDRIRLLASRLPRAPEDNT